MYYIIPKTEMKLGDRLVADGGFTCLQEGEICEVKQEDDELYVECEAGKHFLDGQLNDEDTAYVGFLKERE